jgi:hypothetical protein
LAPRVGACRQLLRALLGEHVALVEENVISVMRG